METIGRREYEKQRQTLDGANELLRFIDDGIGIAAYSVQLTTLLYRLAGDPVQFGFIHDLEWAGGDLHIIQTPAELESVWNSHDPKRAERIKRATIVMLSIHRETAK